MQHRAGVGDVRGRPRDQSGGLLHSGQEPRPDRPPVHPDRACKACYEFAGDVNGMKAEALLLQLRTTTVGFLGQSLLYHTT